jgi:hypothetical protein
MIKWLGKNGGELVGTNKYSLRPKLLECFKKSQCPKLGGWFPNLPNKEFKKKSNRTDGKRHYQLA